MGSLSIANIIFNLGISMHKILMTLVCFYCTNVIAGDRFFANHQHQLKTPAAFALQHQSHKFLLQSQPITFEHGTKLITMINQDSSIVEAIAHWSQLSISQQIPYLKKIFALEYKAFGITPPRLLINTTSYPHKTVYFDFDVNNPDAGTVYLNPDKLSKMGKFDSLAFLIHETRHSYQFQLAYSNANNHLSHGYKQAFITQKSSLPGSLSFSDFLTLVNEYEAFMFGNYVIGQLTNWQVDQSSLGTYASQFDEQGQLKIDLITIHENADSSATIVAVFNQLMIAQKKYLNQ